MAWKWWFKKFRWYHHHPYTRGYCTETQRWIKNIEVSTNIHGNKAKAYNAFKDRNDSNPSPLQNNDFPEEIFEATIKTSNAGTSSGHDALKAHK